MRSFSGYITEGRYFYIAVAAILALNLLFQIFLAVPQWRRLERLSSEEEMLSRERADLRGRLKERRETAGRLSALREDMELFIGNLPAEGEMPRIISEFHGIARKSGLAISSATYSPPSVRDGEMVRYGVAFPVTGDYRQVRRFIYNVEAMPYLMSIDEISLTSNRDRKVSLTLKISLYFRTETR